MNRVSVGKRYEDEVAAWLDGHGYSVLERNFRFRHKEIDIIAEKDSLLVFVEVKYRKDGAFGTGLEAVTVSKRRNIRTAALYYLEKNRRYDCNVRFDVATFEREKLLYIEDAFQLTK
ncbi:MAG: YraN family protein [Spirochaetes bacterium]|nr:YraN family protein [Spirochaetota bacterium]